MKARDRAKNGIKRAVAQIRAADEILHETVVKEHVDGALVEMRIGMALHGVERDECSAAVRLAQHGEPTAKPFHRMIPGHEAAGVEVRRAGERGVYGNRGEDAVRRGWARGDFRREGIRKSARAVQ